MFAHPGETPKSDLTLVVPRVFCLLEEPFSLYEKNPEH